MSDVLDVEEERVSDATPRRRLGRGLSALLGGGHPAAELPLPGANPPSTGGELSELPLDLIDRNPDQPRKDFDLQALQELVESIRQHGVLQPLLVRPLPHGRYQLIVGERRWLAARDAGLQTVPCRLLELADRAVSEVAIVENLQREDLNDLEKAVAFQKYIEQFQCTIEELAGKLGKDRSTVSNCLRLLELPNFVKEALRVGKITAGHARALLPLDEEADQIAMCQRVQSESMSVRQTEQAVREALESRHESSTVPLRRGREAPAGKTARLSNHVLSLQDQLRQVVGCKVEIRLSGKNAGKMIIHFNTNDDFERVVEVLKRAS